MSEEQTLIQVSKDRGGRVLVSVNGKLTTLKTDGPIAVNDHILQALENSNVRFEKVGSALSAAPTGGEDGAAGEQPPASPQTSEGPAVDLSVLDQAIPAVLDAVKDFSADELAVVLAAEQGGKTRKGVLDGIAALPQLAPPATTEA